MMVVCGLTLRGDVGCNNVVTQPPDKKNKNWSIVVRAQSLSAAQASECRE